MNFTITNNTIIENVFVLFILQTWTKYLVKIEAIKFFPSFVKISFLKHPNEEYTNLIVRIHIPGLSVEMVSDRLMSSVVVCLLFVSKLIKVITANL
jgi:hypothetical protein